MNINHRPSSHGQLCLLVMSSECPQEHIALRMYYLNQDLLGCSSCPSALFSAVIAVTKAVAATTKWPINIMKCIPVSYGKYFELACVPLGCCIAASCSESLRFS